MNVQGRRKKRVRTSHIVFLALAVLATFALAWWQWTRFQAGSGTFQNLGYAFQWPLFGAFFVFAYRKYLEYENEMIEAEENSDDPDFLYEADKAEFGDRVTELPADFLPQRPTLDVATFNEINTPRRGRDSETNRSVRDDTDTTGDTTS
ncbi:membrane protein [Corynebacterium halotolerans]|uniref:membrane protein n=1 Tax=Corynebacterium halotolerans TaxID=225326 RepID=UPI0005A86D4D|nr:membrane protein [Corynebacterium halotolerans]